MRAVLGHSLSLLIGVSIIPQVLFFVFLWFIPETPKYLMIIRKDRESALKSLHFFQGEKKENEQLLDVFEKEAQSDAKQKRSSLKELWHTWYLRHVVIVATVVNVLSLSFFTMLQSSTHFLLGIGIEQGLAEISSTGLMVLNAIGSIIGSTFIDRFPRRMLVVCFGAVCTVLLALFAGFSVMYGVADVMKHFALGALCCYIFAYGMILGPIMWFIAPEMVSQRHRSTVFCFVFLFTNVMIVICNSATILFFDIIGAYILLVFLIVPSAVSVVYIYLHMPETLRKEPHDVVEDMHRKYHDTSVDEDDAEA
ncbi:Protein Y39E4B.5 [Aphelenchoides avenae]|nr:Protein Y39E4B.5 [Aphelenchus avenae]